MTTKLSAKRETAIYSAPHCDHFCHDADSGLNPWVRACPVCGCTNPDFDPEAVSDIAPFSVLWETR